MILENTDVISDEVLAYKKMGGGTIVECSIDGIGKDPTALKQISENTGVNVVMGTGYYLARVHPSDMSSKTIDDLKEKFLLELTVGVEGGIKAGIIGELGCSTNIDDNEVKVLKAAALAQKETGAAISIHPGYSKESPMQVADILEQAGADLSRVIIGHIDRGILEIEDMIALAKRGCVLEFDQFGWGCSFTHALTYDIVYPSDFARCYFIQQLVDAGFQDQIVIAHDIAFKSRLCKYGGTGYAYILTSIVPFMSKIGLSDEQINGCLIETPKRLLTIP